MDLSNWTPEGDRKAKAERAAAVKVQLAKLMDKGYLKDPEEPSFKASLIHKLIRGKGPHTVWATSYAHKAKLKVGKDLFLFRYPPVNGAPSVLDYHLTLNACTKMHDYVRTPEEQAVVDFCMDQITPLLGAPLETKKKKLAVPARRKIKDPHAKRSTFAEAVHRLHETGSILPEVVSTLPEIVSTFPEIVSILPEIVSKEVVGKEVVQPVSNSTEVVLIPLIRSVIGDEEVNSVDARKLHGFLESKRNFGNWITDRIKQYDLQEGTDFCSFNNSVKRAIGGTTLIEYALTLNAAKELSMVERTVKGKEARQYFIECERVKKELEAKPIVPACTIPGAPAFLIPDFNNPLECVTALTDISSAYTGALKSWANTIVEKDAAIIERDVASTERDDAIRTKRYISDKKTASAMGTAGALAKKVKKLEAEIRLRDTLAPGLYVPIS